MSYSDKIIKRLNGVVFGYYKTKEVRNLSVKEINNPVAFDQLNRPKQGGLYDPAMGVSPYDKFGKCVTCGQEGLNCPGHLGHIELLLPVYNPFLMDKLYKLLKSKCFTCNRLRIPEDRIEAYHNVILLLKLGYLSESLQYETLAGNKLLRKENKSSKMKTESDNETNFESKLQSRKTSEADESHIKKKKKETNKIVDEIEENINNKPKKKNNKKNIDEINEIEAAEITKMYAGILTACKKKMEKIEELFDIREKIEEFERGVVSTSGINKILRETISNFWACINSQKCPHCGSRPVSLKKEGTTKIFISKKKIEKDIDLEKSENQEKEENLEEEEENKIIDKDKNKEKEKSKHFNFLNALEVRDHLKSLWKNEKSILNLIFGNVLINSKTLKETSQGYRIVSSGYRMFFMEVVPVPPNRFRPENKLSDQTFLHGQTVTLTKLLTLNIEFRNMLLQKKSKDKLDLNATTNLEIKTDLSLIKEIKKIVKLADLMKKWLEIQDCVNCFLDASKAMKPADREGVGIKQLLEKKEGLFRMKMMGKRVNFAARSVISPDPYLDTNEVGVPLFMAKKLTFPEYVNESNIKKLRTMIINGPFKYPGANILEENGNRVSLETRTEQQRIALAKTLMNNFSQKIVYRHLMTGDVLLFNRQPTLHKPSIMSHIARVLPKEQTIRMHYANCNSYNADFDGDEMNLHFVQNQIARSEGYSISLTDKQYVVPKDGKPIRGLIQDNIVSSAFITSKDRFLTKHEFQELLYIATWNLVNSNSNKEKKIIQVKPAVLKPKPLWTGKQLISNILKIIASYDKNDDSQDLVGLNMESKTKLPSDVFGIFGKEETQVIIIDNELIQGVLDKNQIGNSEFGIVHSFYELYGPTLTGKLLTSFSRVFTAFLQFNGFSCGVEDLFLDKYNEIERKNLINEAHLNAVQHIANYAGLDDFEAKQTWNLCNRPNYDLNEKGKFELNILKRVEDIDYIGEENKLVSTLKSKILMEKDILAELDQQMKGALNQSTSKILKLTNNGLLKSYPKNYFSAMVLTGAKGSTVNHNQVSVMLGQQELEGRRVPIMPSGKTLPSFIPYDPNPRSSGYITDRFLSGLRPQDFFFHCMAGREGLIDTAVKTSRSGYLQRCLMKHLEALIVNYDYTVRDADGSIVQFYYGEDSIDPCKKQYLEKFPFLIKNFKGYSQRYNPRKLALALNQKDVRDYLKQRKENPQILKQETILSKFFPGSHIGAISEKAYFTVSDYILNERKKEKSSIFSNCELDDKKFFTLFNIKYFYSLVTPGDGVGPIAAQSIGEPSTQMTLNTFHLAGHGGANVTLGIPRLREILMTATENIKTPSMTLKFSDDNISKEDAEAYSRKLQRVVLIELINNIKIKEKNKLSSKGKVLGFEERARIYDIHIEFEDMEAIKYAFGTDKNLIKTKLERNFIPNILMHIHKLLKKTGAKNFEIKSRVIKAQHEELEDEKVDFIEPKDDDEDPVLNKILNETEEPLRKGSEDSIHEEKQKEPLQDAQESNLLAGRQYMQYLKKFSFDNNVCKIKIKIPLDSKKLLMINLVEYALQITLVYEIKGITKTHLLKNEKGNTKEYLIQTEGVNYKACWNFNFIDVNKIHSNDIQSICKTYGIEAARNSIIREINNVFSAYHISVDLRHLSLVADYMTFSGEIKAMNRTGMQDCASSFLKMSYETTMNFLTQASSTKETEYMNTPSAQIVLGRVPKVGTGIFDILYTIK